MKHKIAWSIAIPWNGWRVLHLYCRLWLCGGWHFESGFNTWDYQTEKIIWLEGTVHYLCHGQQIMQNEAVVPPPPLCTLKWITVTLFRFYILYKKHSEAGGMEFVVPWSTLLSTDNHCTGIQPTTSFLEGFSNLCPILICYLECPSSLMQPTLKLDSGQEGYA